MSESHNGIELRDPWPPKDQNPKSLQPMRVPYLEEPPALIPVDGGRQLFVDDFLVEDSWMVRVHHKPVKHTGNPVFFPQTPAEKNDRLPPTAIPKCGAVRFDEEEQIFKMWYMASYVGALAYAVSDDGIHWERPNLDVVPGTNLVLPENMHPDSGTVWLDREADAPDERYKMMIREPNPPGKGRFPGLMTTSADGIHWSEPVETGSMDDRSTFFYNPFRKKWVQSIRSWIPPRRRCRLYHEGDTFLESGTWEQGEPVFWTGADCMDEAGEAPAELYNLDAVAYESILVGMHQILKGPPNRFGAACGMPKLTELTLGTSRDGFHWHRPVRSPFIPADRTPGSWEYGYVESTGGVLLVVGEELWFYYSAYAGDPERITDVPLANGMYGNGAVGLARLRRDGFASMQARIPGATLTTRPIRFSGSRFFVNANTAGADLTVELLTPDNKILDGFSMEDCIPFCGNATCREIRWRDDRSVGEMRGNPVKARFRMDRGDLYAFWITDSETGESGGFAGAGHCTASVRAM